MIASVLGNRHQTEAHSKLGPETRAPVMVCGLGSGEAYCGLLTLRAAQGTTAEEHDAAGLGTCVGGSTPQPTM